MIKIGTGFLYNGKNFLDVRQGEADTLEDLRTWNLNIPPGFEVCVDGVWYVYNPEYTFDSETGYFRKRIDVELGDSVDFSGVQSQIDELMTEVFPLSLTISGGDTYELGSTQTPHLTWTVKRKGSTVNPTSATVDNSTEGVSADKKSWTGSPITNTKTYTVRVGYQGLTKSGTASYTFRLRKYYGVSSSDTLGQLNSDNERIIDVAREDLSGFSSTWATGWTMGATDFNCTGGKYPYYIIPSSYYNADTFKCWVGGLRNTDLVVSMQKLTNASGYIDPQTGEPPLYAVIRLGTLQTGQLSIRFATE